MPGITDYLTVSQAAKKRGVSRQAILHLITEGKLQATRIGRNWLIHKRDLAAYTPDPGGRPPAKRTKKSPKASKAPGSKRQ